MPKPFPTRKPTKAENIDRLSNELTYEQAIIVNRPTEPDKKAKNAPFRRVIPIAERGDYGRIGPDVFSPPQVDQLRSWYLTVRDVETIVDEEIDLNWLMSILDGMAPALKGPKVREILRDIRYRGPDWRAHFKAEGERLRHLQHLSGQERRSSASAPCDAGPDASYPRKPYSRLATRGDAR